MWYIWRNNFFCWDGVCVFYMQVIANMNAAYKREKKKNAKRRTQNMSSVTFKIADPLFAVRDSPSPKKLKESLYLSFPVETVLTTEQSGSEDLKTELAYHLVESDVQWEQCEKVQKGHVIRAKLLTCWQKLPEVMDSKDVDPDVGEVCVINDANFHSSWTHYWQLFHKAGTTNREPHPDLRADWAYDGKPSVFRLRES